VNPRAAEDNADPSGGASGPSDSALPGDPDDQILFFYLAADSAEDNDDQAAVEENLERLLDVARWRGPETDRGTTIGNAALIAERTGLPVVALDLHRLARAAEPGHYNIMQNYIDFILDVELADEYPEAERLYNILMTDGKDHRPFRTLILGIRLDSATLEAIPNQEERIRQVLAGVTAEPTAGRFFEILKLRPDVLGWDALRSAARTVAESADDSISRSTVLQLLAAALGRSSNHVHEREVADMGRWFLTAGLACRSGNGPYAGTFYNIALQLGSLGYRRAATLAYAEAYRLAPLDPDSRRALATSLERLGRNEDATAVLLGRSIDLGNIQPEELPSFLSAADQTERWWEGLDVGASEPCPTELGWLITRPPASRAGDG
jgi:tetratricopeptide (TPR) repeat protein